MDKPTRGLMLKASKHETKGASSSCPKGSWRTEAATWSELAVVTLLEDNITWRGPYIGVPTYSWMVFMGKSQSKMDDLGVPTCMETSHVCLGFALHTSAFCALWASFRKSSSPSRARSNLFPMLELSFQNWLKGKHGKITQKHI